MADRINRVDFTGTMVHAIRPRENDYGWDISQHKLTVSIGACASFFWSVFAQVSSFRDHETPRPRRPYYSS